MPEDVRRRQAARIRPISEMDHIVINVHDIHSRLVVNGSDRRRFGHGIIQPLILRPYESRVVAVPTSYSEPILRPENPKVVDEGGDGGSGFESECWSTEGFV